VRAHFQQSELMRSAGNTGDDHDDDVSQVRRPLMIPVRAQEYHCLSLAREMVLLLELVSDESYKTFFVHLYVRCANNIAFGANLLVIFSVLNNN
jgi:hypothetical protein